MQVNQTFSLKRFLAISVGPFIMIFTHSVNSRCCVQMMHKSKNGDSCDSILCVLCSIYLMLISNIPVKLNIDKHFSSVLGLSFQVSPTASLPAVPRVLPFIDFSLSYFPPLVFRKKHSLNGGKRFFFPHF